MNGDGSNPDHIDRALVSGLLRIAVNETQRPVDHLIARLSQPDAQEWFDEALSNGPVGRAGDPRLLLLEGQADVPQLEELKTDSKKEFASAGEADSRMTGLMHYLFVISAALEHHGLLLSSQPRGELSAVLLELAFSLPAPWNDFVAEAAMTPQESRG